MSKSIVWYTGNTHEPLIQSMCQKQLERARGQIEIVSVSLNKVLDFGDNRITLSGTPSIEMMHRQILTGLEASTADVVFLCECDVLYHPSHFDFCPPLDTFCYNTNVWKVRCPDGLAVWTEDLQQVSGLCAQRDVLLDFYSKRIAQLGRFNRHYEPGLKQTVGCQNVQNHRSAFPNLCIRHSRNLTKSKWSPSEFRNPRYAQGWTETYEVADWGDTRQLFYELPIPT